MKYVLLSMALTLLVSCAKKENTDIDISKKFLLIKLGK